MIKLKEDPNNENLKKSQDILDRIAKRDLYKMVMQINLTTDDIQLIESIKLNNS
jgi:hypothetical protein